MKRSNLQKGQQTIWITGASSGIGEEVAYQFAQRGYRLILTALDDDQLPRVAGLCQKQGAAAVAMLPADLSVVEQIENLAKQAWDTFGEIDIVYSNAGISQRANTVETDLSVFYKVMNLNYYAAVIIVKTLLPKMIQKGGGQFAVTTSIAGKFGFPLRSAYCSSKHALYGFFETVQAEFFKDNIRVTIVCPGRVQTNISLHALEKDGTPHGKMDKGQAGGLSAKKAGKQIAKAIIAKKREILVGRKELIMVYIKRFFPSLASKMARSIANM